MPAPNSTVLNIMNAPGFTSRELTEAINVTPNTYGRVGELGLMPYRGKATTYVRLQYNGSTVRLIPSGERGGVNTFNAPRSRSTKFFEIPHFPLDDALTAVDIQNCGQAGDPNMLENAENLMAEKLSDIAQSHYLTLEAIRTSALSGVILDSNGSIIYDLYQEFNITQKVINFDLAAAATLVSEKARRVKRHMEQNLFGERMTGIRALCSPSFWDAFIEHASVKDAYKYYQDGVQPLRDDLRSGFYFQGIFWEEYAGKGSFNPNDGTPIITRDFIPDGEARFFPIGTSAFKTYGAPPDAVSKANKAPSEQEMIHVSLEPMDHDKGIEIHTQMNILPLCNRPQLLVKGTIS